jgi:cytochrome P450
MTATQADVPDVPYFDLADPSFDVTSEVVHAARDESWYVHTPYGLAVLRYNEVGALLKDRRLRQGSAAWPAHNGIHSGLFTDWWNDVLMNLEGEDHHRIRRLLNPAFSPKVINAMVPQFQALAEELVDAFVDEGRCEFVSQFAEPYSARILCILLGLPESEWQQISTWAVDLGLSLGVTFAQDLDKIHAALEGLYGYCNELIADRRDNPRDDLTTRLVQASRDEDRLTETELAVSLVFLIFAGMDTTRNQLGLALQTFLRHPDQWAKLAERPELGRAAVEEVMRVNPTITWITREALEPFTFQGLEIEQGQTIQLFSHSAGTDPSAMADTTFDIEGERASHMGFGGGVHHCLGHFVARTDMSVALPLLARRLRNPRADGPGEWLPMSGNTGPVRFPITFTPGA